MNEGDKDKINHGQLYVCTYTCAEQYHTADRLPVGLSCPSLETCPCSQGQLPTALRMMAVWTEREGAVETPTISAHVLINECLQSFMW